MLNLLVMNVSYFNSKRASKQQMIYSKIYSNYLLNFHVFFIKNESFC